jgi:hypothetical protein
MTSESLTSPPSTSVPIFHLVIIALALSFKDASVSPWGESRCEFLNLSGTVRSDC